MESCCAQRYLNFVYRMRFASPRSKNVYKKRRGQTPSEQWNAEMFDFIYAVDSVFLQYKKAVICKEWNKLLYNGNRMKKTCLFLIRKTGNSRRSVFMMKKGVLSGYMST